MSIWRDVLAPLVASVVVVGAIVLVVVLAYLEVDFWDIFAFWDKK